MKKSHTDDSYDTYDFASTALNSYRVKTVICLKCNLCECEMRLEKLSIAFTHAFMCCSKKNGKYGKEKTQNPVKPVKS